MLSQRPLLKRQCNLCSFSIHVAFSLATAPSTQHPAPRTPHSALRAPHTTDSAHSADFALRTPHSALRTPRRREPKRARVTRRSPATATSAWW
eukprot:5829478-Pleurochrysis_carterae.AAC.1